MGFSRLGKRAILPVVLVSRAKLESDLSRRRAHERARSRRIPIQPPASSAAGPYRFFFFSGDREEPPHVHVERDRNRAKFWLDPVRIQESGGFRRSEILRVHGLVREHQALLLRTWHEFFGTWSVRHRDWQGDVELYEDGRIGRPGWGARPRYEGTWSFENDRLRLRWRGPTARRPSSRRSPSVPPRPRWSGAGRCRGGSDRSRAAPRDPSLRGAGGSFGP